MDPATVELVKVIATDAIKILGPAIIAGWATYRASKAQFEIKLKELEKAHEFGAREHLFKYYRDRQEQLKRDYEQLSRSLGETLGLAAGYAEGAQEVGALLNTMSEYVEMFSRVAPTEIEMTAKDMERSGLADTDEYKNLRANLEPIENLDGRKTLEALQKNIFKVLNAYHFLQHCNQLLLQKQIDKIFSKYFEA